MDALVPALLPTGLWVDGACHREAVLRPPSGHDELWAGQPAGPMAAQATALLARCLVRLGGISPVPPEAVAALPVGDREAALLRLRAIAFGERIASTFPCQSAGCGKPMDIQVSVPDLLQAPYATNDPTFEVALGKGQGVLLLRCRLPTGGDQEAVAPLAAQDAGDAAAELARRCILAARRGGRDVPVPELSRARLARLSEALRERDAQAECVLATTCPACGAAQSIHLDAGAFLLQEMRDGARDLFWEVHHLALHYHWSEQDILGLDAGRRRLYLKLLGQAVVGAEA
jgi:hypothetical protein